jgi:hypothetical protein
MAAGLASALQGATYAAVAAKGRLRRSPSVPMWWQSVERSTVAAKIRFANRHFHLPQSKAIRIGLGILLIACGLVGFLPVVGFWMIPLGLLVLSVDIPIVRRWRRRLAVWWHRDRKENGGTAPNGTGAPGKDFVKTKVE